MEVKTAAIYLNGETNTASPHLPAQPRCQQCFKMSSSLWKLAALAGFFLCLSGVSPARPRINIVPKFAHIKKNETVNITCNARQPIIGCQFKVDNVNLDLRRGASSRLEPGFKYYGSGLDRGDCGLQMYKVAAGIRILVECRVRSQDGGWTNDFMSVSMLTGLHLLDVSSEPAGDLVVLPGHSVSLRHRTSLSYVNLARCKVELNIDSKLKSLNFYQGKKSTVTDGVEYFGAGFKYGECGFKILNVNEGNNDFLWSYFSHAALVISLIVAKPPESTNLNVFKGEIVLTATCYASNSRPVANITWYLDNDVIRSDEDDETLVDNNTPWVRKHDIHSISQSVSLRLRPEDEGKNLVCQIQHMAMKSPGFIKLTRTISISGDDVEADDWRYTYIMALSIYSVSIAAIFSALATGTLVAAVFLYRAGH